MSGGPEFEQTPQVLDRSDIDAITEELLDALETATPLPLITERFPHFELDDAYEVLRRIASVRRGAGWRTVGRKIGFTNATLWDRYNVEAPMWAHMWDQTVELVATDVVEVVLGGVLEPRIEPEVVVKLSAPLPVTGDAVDVLDSIEWIAAGFEIVQSVFPGWRFALADCTAAFGLHGRLVVGPPTPVAPEHRTQLAAQLGKFEAVLQRDGAVVDRGVGSNVLGSPLLALRHLAGVVATQPSQPPIAAGEIITTGTLTNAWPVQPGERWSSDYGLLGVAGLTVDFV